MIAIDVRPAHQRLRTGHLSAEDRELLRLLADGRRYEEAAVEFGISKKAIFTRVQRLKDKMGTNTTAGAVAAALREGAID